MPTDGKSNEPAPNQQYPDSAFLEAIEDGHKGTGEIAEYVGCERRTADYRLKQLREDGQVMSETIGRTLVWSLVKVPDE